MDLNTDRSAFCKHLDAFGKVLFSQHFIDSAADPATHAVHTGYFGSRKSCDNGQDLIIDMDGTHVIRLRGNFCSILQHFKFLVIAHQFHLR